MSKNENPQQAVAHARTQVLAGRGPGADLAEIAQATRERPTLGSLPAPLEREMVHLHTALMRNAAEDVDITRVQDEIDRLREIWAGTAP